MKLPQLNHPEIRIINLKKSKKFWWWIFKDIKGKTYYLYGRNFNLK